VAVPDDKYAAVEAKQLAHRGHRGYLFDAAVQELIHIGIEGTEFRCAQLNCYWMEMMFGFLFAFFVKVLGIILLCSYSTWLQPSMVSASLIISFLPQ
jgi:hypothetical protein